MSHLIDRIESQRDRAIAAGEELLAQRDAALARAAAAEVQASTLRARLETPTPKMIAAAWAAFRRDRMGRLGPGPGFVEAIQAAGRIALADASRQAAWPSSASADAPSGGQPANADAETQPSGGRAAVRTDNG